MNIEHAQVNEIGLSIVSQRELIIFAPDRGEHSQKRERVYLVYFVDA